MHTFLYNSDKLVDKKKLIYDELITDLYKDSLDVPIIKYLIESFAHEEEPADNVINYVMGKAAFIEEDDGNNEEEDSAEKGSQSIVNKEINLLLSYKILTRTSAPPTIILKKLIRIER